MVRCTDEVTDAICLSTILTGNFQFPRNVWHLLLAVKGSIRHETEKACVTRRTYVEIKFSAREAASM